MAHDDLTFSQFFKICLPCHIRVSCKDKVGFRREHGKSQRLHLCHEGLPCLYDPRSRIVKVLHIFQCFCSRQDRQAIEIIRVETELDPIEIFDDLLIGNGKPYTCSRKTSRLGKSLHHKQIIVLVQQRHSTLCAEIHIRFVDHHQLLRIVL